jgi:ferric-dicitrate binding protein FerR (iron transport regulator)
MRRVRGGRILGASDDFGVGSADDREAAMKTTFRTTLLVLALGMTGAAWAQSGVVGELSKGLSNPTAGPTPDPAAAAVDNGALPGDSHVRIVRLSDVKGQLALDRNTGAGFERTMQNMPIVEGERLQTADGYAEVEFEDNSTLRLTPNSGVDFPLLALRSTGAKASTMKVTLGAVYVSTENTKGNEFLLEAGDAKMTVAPSTHLRLEFDGQKTVLSVFNGSVEVQRGSDTTVVNKKETLTLDADQVAVAKKVDGSPYDAWDKESNDYHQRYATANAFAGGGNAFGLSDLNYYGNFINAGAFGSFWQPYFIGAGWSPYANGLWALYPGAGYSWVSPYPWGWLPYHSGTWSFYPGYGWGWQPGGTFNGLNNIVASGVPAGTLTKSGVSSPLRPAEMPQAPAAGTTTSSLVLANQKPVVFSQQDKAGNFVFQRDSAGLGVPRGSLGDLNKLSNDVERRGSASMRVYASTPGGEMGGASRGPMTLRAGSPGNGSMVERGNSSVSSASRQGGYEGSTGAQSASRGGGVSQPAGGAAPMSSPSAVSAGGSHGSVASPK